MKKFGTAIILAGGKSSRMGFDKQQLNVDNNRLINHIIHKLSKEFDEIIVVTNTPAYYSGLPCITVEDEIVQKGPLSGIHIGLKKSSSEYAYVIACDMPNIKFDYIKFMKDRINETKSDACITMFGTEWIEPFNGFYSKSILSDIESYLLRDRKSVFHLLKQVNCYYIDEVKAREYSPNWEMFLNLNTKEDLEKYVNNSINKSIG
ncbi:NTP transferase domain-containing protein [Alkalibaculum sp. M08DMB]|uniref:Probable molybdenum cofactor guanylyltransferase n=1 Tax=Alkalibaculum sporogenes TaxID=2655001 RepID=A0A6A7KBG0_9FIRM|nr:molybdenum cofactor guanylyltransferase [Alkalibaculum sporogenes]MPW26685.1 NTP transferase domain-containing protein [Alkalibaculum sporogenes]